MSETYREGYGPKCPACRSAASGVKNSRATKGSVRRRRYCQDCGERWTTYEITEATAQAIHALLASRSTISDALAQLDSVHGALGDVTEINGTLLPWKRPA